MNTIKTEKKLGIWMDHSIAHVMEFTPNLVENIFVVSNPNHNEKNLSKGESHMHLKEQHQQSEFYSKLGEVIIKYDDVILFGPTNAKVELLNILRENNLFVKIKIETEQADKMTKNQLHAFVKEYFSRN